MHYTVMIRSPTQSLATLFSTVALLGLVPIAAAQPAAPSPTRPSVVRIVVPFTPGASTDLIARAVAAQLGPRLAANVIVENRPGASGLIGAGAVAKGPRDGSMLLVSSSSLVTTAATKPNMPFDVIAELMPIAMLGEGPMVVAVASSTAIKSPADLVAAARAKPDTVTHGSGGIGTIAHMAVELFNDAAKVQMRHIPYKGAAPALADLSAGTIDMMTASYTTLAPGIRSGRARLIGVTSSEPNPTYPGLPTMATVAPGFEASLWVAVFAPAGTPVAVAQRLNREINEIAKEKALRDYMQADGASPRELTLEELAPRVRETYLTWKKLAAAKNIVAD